MRVVVESVRPQHCLSCAHDGNTLFDSYAIVSQHTVLSNLVDTVLSAFNMSALVKNSRGLVQINNWKPLEFDAISENPDATIGDLFKDMHSHVTLKILTKEAESQSNQCINDIKTRLLKTALEKQPQMMNTSNNQIKDAIQQIIEGDDPSMNQEQIEAVQQWLDSLGSDESRRSPVNTVRFNAIQEIPKLERWFNSEPNPSRQKLIHYMGTLNQSQYRKNHSKITYQQICNWFSNQRATNRTSSPRPSSVSQGAQIPLSVVAPAAQDFKNKFQASSGVERHSSSLNMLPERMDGGSDSPTPNDDGSVHSASFDEDHLKQELNSSSPEMSLDLSTSRASTSPKPPMMPNLADVLTACLPTASTANVVPSGASNNGNHSTNGNSQNSHGNPASTAARSRLMFDPLSELPILEKWFEENPHPSWIQIDQFTETLNGCQYRQSYPPISTHNVKIWFKNRRAKCKRMQQSTPDSKFLMHPHPQTLSEMS
ncbi:hypothetical protein L596_014963 [Steinernema carpocapsae]|uniref:Homeobox domain-containing protein n=1 Tax=Steinernema carpocapsae TaxID=34508 RepID=A0A4V6A2Z1_STECR|nr:hypothetical protein L596_014963 [Steinernema carpocapsae]